MIRDHVAHAGWLGGQIVSGDMSRDFVGVQLNRAGLAAETIFNGQIVLLDWVAGAYDFGGWFDDTTPRGVTVPAGVTRIRVHYDIILNGVLLSNSDVLVTPTLAEVADVDRARSILMPGSTTFFSIWHGVTNAYPVSPGDRIGMQVHALSIPGGSTVSIAGVDVVAMTVEAVTMEF